MQRKYVRCMDTRRPARACHLFFHAALAGLTAIGFFITGTSLADGSQDLIQLGGNRPFLEGGHGRTTAGIDRQNQFFVYARAGEIIQLGSSAFGLDRGDILYVRPDGQHGSCSALKPAGAGDAWGRIRSLDEETSGPAPAPGGYTPCRLTVGAGTEGIWRISFLGPDPSSWKFASPLPARAAWIQATDVYTIAAWDITVRNAAGQNRTGRVYAHHLPLNLGSEDATLNATPYALTKDGYLYRIGMNGARAHTLVLFANNRGFQDAASGTSLYRSTWLDESNTANKSLPDGIRFHSPLDSDTDETHTHKLFFATPAADLPSVAKSAAGSVWLRQQTVTLPPPTAFSFSGTVGKGGSFSFSVPSAHRYRIVIDLDKNGVWGDGVDAVLHGLASPGNNSVMWNGIDALGEQVRGAEGGYQARLMLTAGELHLPQFDVEYQANGLIVERLNEVDDHAFTLYYDDRPLANRPGQPDPVNGNGGANSRLGAHAFTERFGDAAAIDTWTFATSAPAVLTEPLYVLRNDLRLAISASTTTPDAGENFTLTLSMANDGPHQTGVVRTRLLAPEGLDVIAAEALNGTYDAASRIWQVTGLPVAGETRLELTGRAGAKGVYPVFAEIIEQEGDDIDSTPDNFDPLLPDVTREDDTGMIELYVDAEPVIGIAKRVLNREGNLSGFTATFELIVSNLGNTPLTDVQVVELLPAIFQGTEYQVIRLEAVPPLAANPAFNGKSEVNLLVAGQSALGVGDQATIQYTVQVTPISSFGPYAGSAQASAKGPGNVQIDDFSDEGASPDPDKNGYPGDPGEDDPTVLNIPENPVIGLAMQVLNIEGDASDFKASYRLVVENLGEAPLHAVQVTNNLVSSFGRGRYTVSNLSAQAPLVANSSFDGDINKGLLNATNSTLGIGKRAIISFDLTATPQLNLGRFNQLAQAFAISPAGVNVTDVSDDGDDPDPNGNGRPDDIGEQDVTILAFDQRPVIGAALVTTRVTGDLGGFAAYYDLRIANLGTVPLYDLQAIEDLGAIFEGTTFSVSELTATHALQVNPGFNGKNDRNLLAGQEYPLMPNETAHITFTVTVQPTSYFGPYRNSVVVYGESADGISATDVSDSGSVVDADGDGQPNEQGENDPLVTAFAPYARLGAALAIDQVDGDLNGFTTNYTVVMENLGDVPLSALSLLQNLDSTFAGVQYKVVSIQADAPLVANERFDGKRYKELLDASTEMLGVGQKAAVKVSVKVTPLDRFGPYRLGALASGVPPIGTKITDRSTQGLDPDPNGNGNPSDPGEDQPAVLSLTERPVIGVSMAAGRIQGDLTEFSTRYVIRLENLGDVPLQDVQVNFDLDNNLEGAAFEVLRQQTRGGVQANRAFDGRQIDQVLDAAASRLGVGDTARIEIDVRIRPETRIGPFTSQVIASAQGPHGAFTTDLSGDGYLIDANRNGISNEDAENKPTVVSLATRPSIGLARTLTMLREENDGFRATFEISAHNLGDVPLSKLQILEDFGSTYAGADVYVIEKNITSTGAFAFNPNFNGVEDLNLLASEGPSLNPGQQVTVQLGIRLVTGEARPTFETRSLATAQDPAGRDVEDWSNNGSDPDPNGNGNAAEANEDTPTRLDLGRRATLDLHSSIVHVVGDTAQFNVEFALHLYNTGSVALDSVQVMAGLSSLFQGATVDVLSSEIIPGAGLVSNPNYDGIAERGLLDASRSRLEAGQSARILYLVQVTPNGIYGPFSGELLATAQAFGERIEVSRRTMPVRLHTSSGRDGGLESNGDLAGLVAERNYRRQHDAGQTASKLASPLWLRQAGTLGVDGTGGYTDPELMDLIPVSGPNAAEALVTTPTDLFGITNATSVLAVDYVLQHQRLAALFTTTTAPGETYEHSKNLCDRLQGGRLLAVELVSIRGYPFVMSVIEQATGDVDYAITFIGYRSGPSYLLDSRFVRDQYHPPFDASGEILNFQVWSFNPAYTIQLVEEIIQRMEAQGIVGFVSQEDDIPVVPEGYIQEGAYRQGALLLHIRNASGATAFTFKGAITELEGGEKMPLDTEVPVPADQLGEPFVTLRVPSGPIYDALLEMGNDATEDVDQVYLADGAWGRVIEGEASSVAAFETLKQPAYTADDNRFVVERGIHFKGTASGDAVLFRQLRPAGRPVDLSTFEYLSFTAAGAGKVQVRLEQANDGGNHFTREIELQPTMTAYTFSFDEFSKIGGSGSYRGASTTALSFAFSGTANEPQNVELRVEDIVFGGEVRPTGLEDDGLIPRVYSLSQNYPNPFNPTTTIVFGLPEAADVDLKVFDLLGREVMTVAHSDYPAGMHRIQVDANRLASGMYVYRLIANENVFTKTMHVIR